jgi:ABC-type Mn2+/Zn2+ transport system permease subunit
LFAVAAGLVGSFALMKRMILAADVISHVALPGLGLAFLWHFNPLLGGGATLFIGTLLIRSVSRTLRHVLREFSVDFFLSRLLLAG